MSELDYKTLRKICPRWIDGYLEDKKTMEQLKNGTWKPDINMDLLEQSDNEEEK